MTLRSSPRRPIRRPNHLPRAAVLAALVGLLAGSVGLSPAAAANLASVPALTPRPATEPARGSLDAPDLAAGPSIQYQQALEHANDVIDFAPGERVSVPFSPRADDAWEVDGRAPRALPAGRASGAQMRAARGGAVLASATMSPSPATTTPTAPISASGLRREVFGFLPYWDVGDSSTTLDWRTLSTVAYFSVGCTSTGGLDKTDADGSLSTGWAGWTGSKMTSIINAAHLNQTRVVLTISCFAWSSSGASRQAALLGSSSARSNLARAAAAAVRDRGADGINLDFEPIVAGYSTEFTALVRSMRSELNKIASGYQLTFDTMGSIGNQPIVDATAPGGADAVFIMGYDYRTDSSSVAGSISPLTGPRYDLTDTVKAYTAKISPSKVILGVPYYGRAWSTATDDPNAATLSQARYGSPASPTYVQALDQADAHGRRWDSVEQAPWTAYHKETCTAAYGCLTSWRELYYDDAQSLRLRYDLVNRQSLRGAGIWALGYDGTRPELRTALADKFLADRSPPLTGVATLAQQQRDEGFKVSWAAWDDSTITGYDVQVSVDGGDWAAWLTGTSLTNSLYFGADGRTYAFRVRAADMYGNVSVWKTLSLGDLGVPDAIAVGGFATVLADGLRMRSAASTGASIMATLSAGDALQVIGGPVSAEGYTWWQVSGPVRQWSPVDPMQVGGWVAAAGNGTTNAGPRRPVYATLVNAGITDLQLANGGERVLTPNDDGSEDTLKVEWINQVAFDSLALRVFRMDGTLAGSVALGGTGAGAHGYSWDGRLGGSPVPAGTYVIQLQGMRGTAASSAPSASPVTPEQIARVGVIVGDAAPTAVLLFERPVSPNRAVSLTWNLTFGGSISALSSADFARSGSATGCVVGTPGGSGAAWSVTLSGCSQGTVTLGLKAATVVDAVRNWGPAAQVNAPSLLIDRSAPSAAAPKVSLRTGVELGSNAPSAGMLATLAWSATDPGGAGVRSYDVKRSVDGGAFGTLVSDVSTATLAITLTPGHAYRFEVRARDNAGNVGGWVAGPTIRAYLPQQTSTAITWKSVLDDRFSGGSVSYATTAGASAKYAFTGRAVGWVTTLAPTRGAAKVYLDGTLVATIDLFADTATFRRVVFAKTWSSSGSHTIRIVVVGTAGHPRVDLDAFEVLR